MQRSNRTTLEFFMLQASTVELDQYVVVDEERILNCGGDREFLLSLLQEFVEIYGDAPQQLREFLIRGEIEKALQLLHSIKGGSGNVGLQQIAATTGALEKALHAPGDTSELINTLEKAIGNLSGYLLEKSVGKELKVRE